MPEEVKADDPMDKVEGQDADVLEECGEKEAAGNDDAGEEVVGDCEAVGNSTSEADATADGANAAAIPKQEDAGPKELECDAGEDNTRPRLSEPVEWLVEDSTLNVMPTAGGKLLMALRDHGFQQLLAGARANVGVKAGRYMFEVSVVEETRRSETTGNVMPPFVRLGLSVEGARLLSDVREQGSISFDSEGFFVDGKERKKAGKRFGRDQVVALLLNLDSDSPNANTISLFVDGERASEPMKLPEAFHGKTLYPTVCYRSATVRVNFGPTPLRQLPFRCLMWQRAAVEDCSLCTATPTDGGKHEVIFPVMLPGEGIEDWCDQFMAGHRHFSELSKRSFHDWVSRSRRSGMGGAAADEKGVSRLVTSVAPLLPRSFVLADVQQNLIVEERKVALAQFPSSEFRRTAVVMIGEPPEEHKKFVQAALLEEKRAKAAEAVRRKRAADAPARKMAKKADGTGKPSDEDKEEMDEAEDMAALDAIELTEEEKSKWFRKGIQSDISQAELAKCFTRFDLPSEAEGFDSIRFDWFPAAKAKEYVHDWILERKSTLRVEGIQPSKWFKDKFADWQKTYQEWKKKQAEWKDVLETLNKWKNEGEDNAGEQPTETDADDLDVFTVENVLDVGSGEPLFANFAFEDWALLSLRYELHLLVYAFRNDVNDPERKSFCDTQLTFYYNRYYKKAFSIKFFGVDEIEDLLGLVKDTMELSGRARLLEPQLQFEETNLDTFIKLTEQDRRDRKRRLEAGDETAALKFDRNAPPAGGPRVPARGTLASQRLEPDANAGNASNSAPQRGDNRHGGSSHSRAHAGPTHRGLPPRPAAPRSGTDKRAPPNARDYPASKTTRSSSSHGPSSARSGPPSSRGPPPSSRGGAPPPPARGYDRPQGTSYDRGGGGGYDRAGNGYDRGAGGPPRPSAYDRPSSGYERPNPGRGSAGGGGGGYNRAGYERGGAYDRGGGGRR